MQWIQDPSQSDVDILNNVRREVRRHFRDKKKAYLRAKIEELETNSMIQNTRDLYRGNNDFMKGYSRNEIWWHTGTHGWRSEGEKGEWRG